MAEAPEWSFGQYQGRLPGEVEMDGSPRAVELEAIIDQAAEEIWNEARRLESN